MNLDQPTDLHLYATQLAARARQAGLKLASTAVESRTRAIRTLASLLRNNVAPLLQANSLDVVAANNAGFALALIKRLVLDEKRVIAMASAVDDIASQPDPVGRVIESNTRADGLKIDRIRVPIGVVLFCYESRPNVTTDAAALCLRSGNAVILRGGKEAFHCNQVLASLIEQSLADASIDPASVQVIQTVDRALLPMLLKLDKFIDVVIPRGGESLIRAVVRDSTIPVLKHFTGNCHVYIDRAHPPLQQVTEVCVNAKTSYPGGAVCNAAEHILIHKDVAPFVLQSITTALREAGVEIKGDAPTRAMDPLVTGVADDEWDVEYLALTVGIKVVDSIEQAIDHINRFGSHHTDAILSTSAASIDLFVKQVDSASVMVNASTRLADGGEYGLGAEIGISTDKLHARGPMGAFDMTTYKWVVTGDGHLR